MEDSDDSNDGYLQNLHGLCTGPWTHSYSGSDQLISLQYYSNISYCVADFTLILDASLVPRQVSRLFVVAGKGSGGSVTP